RRLSAADRRLVAGAGRTLPGSTPVRIEERGRPLATRSDLALASDTTRLARGCRPGHRVGCLARTGQETGIAGRAGVVRTLAGAGRRLARRSERRTSGV